LKQRDTRGLKTAEIKFMRHTGGYILLDHRRNEDILEVFKIHLVEQKLAQYKQKLIMSAGWKTLYTQSNSLIIDLSEDEDLDDHKERIQS
jgi:hypothetical protein